MFSTGVAWRSEARPIGCEPVKYMRKIHAGQPGSRKYMEKYGDRFVCVRHRYDTDSGKRLKTIELIEDEGPVRLRKTWIPKNKILLIRVEYGETDVARLVKAAGGRWNREKRGWELEFQQVHALGLESRIINGK